MDVSNKEEIKFSCQVLCWTGKGPFECSWLPNTITVESNGVFTTNSQEGCKESVDLRFVIASIKHGYNSILTRHGPPVPFEFFWLLFNNQNDLWNLVGALSELNLINQTESASCNIL